MKGYEMLGKYYLIHTKQLYFEKENARNKTFSTLEVMKIFTLYCLARTSYSYHVIVKQDSRVVISSLITFLSSIFNT